MIKTTWGDIYMKEKLLKILLGLIAVYHVLLGLMAFLSGDFVMRIADSLFGLQVEPTGQVFYFGKLLGIYAIAFGAFIGMMMRDPHKYKDLLYVGVGLYALRIINKLVFMNSIKESFGVSDMRIWMDVVLLAFFGIALYLLIPKKK